MIGCLYRTTGILLIVVAVGCATTNTTDKRVATGLALMDGGDYNGAYTLFDSLVTAHPGVPEFRLHRQTAAKYVFRQEMGLAEKSLSSGDLDGFVVHVKQAARVQPSTNAGRLIKLVESARAAGRADGDIVLELMTALQRDCAFPLGTAIGVLADSLRAATQNSKVGTPIAISGIEVPKDIPDYAQVVGNVLSEALVKRGVPIVDRVRMATVLDELKIQSSASFDQATVAEQGKLSGARSILATTATVTTQGMLLQVKVVDVATVLEVWHASALVDLER